MCGLLSSLWRPGLCAVERGGRTYCGALQIQFEDFKLKVTASFGSEISGIDGLCYRRAMCLVAS